MANKKIDYDSINFKNKDVDKFTTKFGKDGNPLLKAPSNTSVSESTNVKTQTFVRPSASEQKDMREQIKKDEEERVRRNSKVGSVG